MPAAQPEQAGTGQDHPRMVTIPPRSSSSEAANTKRVANPSPLSKPMTLDTEGGNGQAADGTDTQLSGAAATRFESPAVRKLTAINEKGGKSKSKTSRLRRAFSFGGAAEFRKAVHDGDATDNPQGKLQKERSPDAYDEEQARIAQQQEEAGIGSNIYAGGRFFHGSTDNLSISSTASSASIMIRKMGRGMKKGTRSLVGLFRPKSIIGAPSNEAKQSETTQTAVSMITVEAERERVNVNADPKAQTGGGTGFPRLERNSIDASKVPAAEQERLGSSGTDSTAARKSIVGGEKERAEVLAAVRKGILKSKCLLRTHPWLWFLLILISFQIAVGLRVPRRGLRRARAVLSICQAYRMPRIHRVRARLAHPMRSRKSGQEQLRLAARIISCRPSDSVRTLRAARVPLREASGMRRSVLKSSFLRHGRVRSMTAGVKLPRATV